MAFSDAEEDHQGSRRRDGRQRNNSGGGNSDRERSTSRSRTESGVSNASTVSLASPPAAPPPPPPPLNGEPAGPSTSSGGASNSSLAGGASNAVRVDISNKLLDMKSCMVMARGLMRRITSGRGVDSKRIMEKLQQIQGYIQQTATAMAALEQQGDLDNIGQYNTLVKVMRDLKDSEAKLQGHLVTAQSNERDVAESNERNSAQSNERETAQSNEENSAQSNERNSFLSNERETVRNYERAAEQVVNGTQNDGLSISPPTNGVEEPTPANTQSRGNQIVGIVRPGNVQGLSLQERLAASQIESTEIVTRMRDSIARREDLMTRYKATRERLESLKKQREDMREEQRRLQDSSGDASDPSLEDPVPGAETWASEDIANSIVEFQTLFEKVARIQDMYVVKQQTVDPNDEEAQAHIANKMEQVAGKRRQLIEALTKLRRIQRQRESGEQTDAGDGRDSQPNSTNTRHSNSAANPAESDGHPNARSEHHSTADASSALGLRSRASSNEGESGVDLGPAMTRMGRISDEVTSKRDELARLQQQFQDMKKLLDVTTSARMDDERRMLDSQKRLREAEALVAESRRVKASLDAAAQSSDGDGAIGGEEIISLSGHHVQLSEIERQNPEVMSKYQDLARAKERLAKMEEVMSMIVTAKNNRQDVRDVLPPDYLSLLEDAENEYPEGNRTRRQPPEVSVIEEESEDEMRTSRHYQRSSRRGSASRGDSSGSLGRNERDRYTREQESREISAMQKRLNKTSSRISSVNEGSRHGLEKGAVKKQPQALWQERNSNIDPRNSNIDPRMTEVMALQEELKQKKNALEALMRRMGKSSSMNMDNISDNISDNVSDNGSDRADGGTTATWGTAALHDYSDNHYHQSSEDELVEAEEAGILQRSHRRSQPPGPPPSGPPKDRNRYCEDELVEAEEAEILQRSHRRSHPPAPPPSGPPKDRNRYSGSSRHRRRADSSQGHISVNNLTTAPGGRPKHNRFRGSSVPKASWEPVPPSLDERNFKSPSNTTLQAQQSIGAALSQLSQVQGTINNLHETLRHEQTMMGPGNMHGPVVPQMLPDLPTPSLPSSSVSHMPSVGVQPLTPMTAYAGLGSLSLGGSDPNGTQMVSLMQQCVSQLQLHSLEIQALSKHLQLIDRREVGGSAPISDSGGGGRLGRGGARRSEEDEEEEEDDEDEDVTSAHPSYALHHNLLGAQLSQDDREGSSQVPMGHSFPVYLGQAGDDGHSSGVTNPIYGRLGDIRDQPRVWGSHGPASGVEQSSDHLATLMEAPGVLENSPSSHPLFHLDRTSEERPQSQPHAPDDHHWASLSSSHPLHHQTTDLLNNQVPPGTRANNYWDNFRSYSRQNLLSTATKSNTSEHRPSSCTSAAGPSGSAARHQSGDGGQVEDKRFNVTMSHNNNSSGAGGGARSRMSNPRLNNPKGARVRNAVSSTRQQVHGQNKHKTNNRMKQGSTNIPGGNALPLTPTTGVSHDRSLVNYSSTRANSSDSDGGIGGVTLEVLREAESLMRCHSNQPEFLLQLFRHASQITVHTDQHVAVALLQDLAARPHRGNHGVNNQGNNNDNLSLPVSSFSLPAPLRESSWRRSGCRSDHHNILPQENGSVAGLSGSEVSDSGLTSEDEDSRADERWLNQENTDQEGRKSQNELDTAGSSPEHAPHITHPLSNDTEFLSFESLVSSAVRGSVELLQSHTGAITPANTVTPLLLSAIHNTVVGQVCKVCSLKQTTVQTQAQSLNLPQSFLFSVDTELKTALHAFIGKRILDVSNEVPSVISQVLLTQYCTVLVQRLRDNHTALPQTPTKLPQNKQTQMSDSSFETAASASSVGHSRHAQENTTATQTESSVFSIVPHQHAGLSSSSSETVPRSSYHASHPASMISVASGVSHNASLPSHSTTTCHSSVHSSSSPHPSPHLANSLFQSSSTSGQWQAPFSIPAPSPSGPSTLTESSHDAINNLPTSQPEAWAASSLISQVTESPVSLSRPESRSTGNANQPSAGGASAQEWEEPEHEEAVMDDEPLLPVYDLAEADQSQDAGDAAEGDWEDSQAEGIQADGASGITDESPEHPIRLQADVEGMAECEADAAEVSGRGAMVHLLYGDHLVQGAARELGLDEVPTKLQSPDGGSPGGTPEHHSSTPQGHHSSTPEGQHHPTGPSHAVQPLHSPGGEG